MEWTQVSKLKLEFLKIQTDVLYSAIELCQGSKSQYWSSKLDSKLKESGFVWNEIKKLGQNGYSENSTDRKDFLISETANGEITKSNLKFLAEQTNWCDFKALLLQAGILSTPGQKSSPQDDYVAVFNCNFDPTNPKFLDILKESGNGRLAQLLCSAGKEFVKSETYETANANFKENEEDLSKLDARNSIKLLGTNIDVLESSSSSLNFLHYLRLPEFSQIFNLSVEVKSLMDRMAELQFIKNFADTDYQCDETKLKVSSSAVSENKRMEEVHTDQIHTGATFLKYSGTVKRTEIFSRRMLNPGPLGHPSILTWLHLEHLDIYTPLLFQTLTNCVNLRVLRILDVRFIGELNRRVTLPKIESFALATRLTNLEKAEGRNLSRSMLKSLIFFERDTSNASWKVENISDLNTDIDISINGDRIFKIRHHDGLLYSQLNYTNEILKSLCKFQFKQLFLRFCEIEITSLPENLTLLEVKDVTFPRGGNFSDVINQCKGLTTLGVSYTQSTVCNLLQLSQFGNNLRYLYFFNVHIPYLPVVVKLDTLFLYCCSFAPESVDKFSRIFKARSVSIICKTMEKEYSNFCSFCCHIKILNELRKSECAEWVSVKKFDRGHRNNHTDKRHYLVENEIETFLKKAGVTKGSSHFILKKKEGVQGWVGKDVVVDDKGWMEQQGVIQRFEVIEDDKGVRCSNISGSTRQLILPGVS